VVSVWDAMCLVDAPLPMEPPNPKVVCVLALIMHSSFGLSLGVGFSIPII
jgi:hypothetical protein